MPLQLSSLPLHTSALLDEHPSVAVKVKVAMQVLGPGAGSALHCPGTQLKWTVPVIVVADVNMPVTVQCGHLLLLVKVKAPVPSTVIVPDGVAVDGPGHPGACEGATKLNPVMTVPELLTVAVTAEPWLVVPDHWPSVPVTARLWRSMTEPD
jgi:hypothetical protein